MRKTFAADVPQKVGQTVVLGGWVHRLRQLSSATFVILKDASGTMQCVADPARLQGVHVKLDDAVEIEGTVRADERSRYGGVEVDIVSLKVVGAATEDLPFHGSGDLAPVGQEVLLAHRPLSLRNDRVGAIFRVQAALLELFREGVVAFDQATPLGDLHLRWTGTDDGDIDVGDEFDGGTEPGPPEGAEPTDEGPEGRSTPEPQTLRDYLLAHVHRRADLYLGPYGLAMLRLYVEARAYPDLFGAIREQAISRLVLDERERVAQAVRAGVLPPDAAPVRILDAVEGAIFMHLLVTPPELLDRVRAGLDDYVERMVDDQLRAAGYDAQADAERVRRLSPPGS